MNVNNDMVPVAEPKKSGELERWAKVLEIAPEHALTEAIMIEYKSPNGIVIPQQVKAPKPSFFKVLKMGAVFAEHPNTKGVQIGDIVVPHTGYPFNVDGKGVQIVKAENCIGRVPKADWEASLKR